MIESNICLHTKCPFNIRSTSKLWLGQIGSYKGFAKFEDYDMGIRAGMKLIANYIRLYDRDSVTKIIMPYAPPSENNTQSYIDYVEKACDHYGVSTQNISVGSDSFFVVLRAMAIFESGYVIDFDRLHYIYDTWKI